MADFIPKMFVKGRYRLLAPFDNKLAPNVLYEPVSISSLTDIAASGLDPFAEYYGPASLTREQYQQDVLNNVSIVTFRPEQGSRVHVPSNYIDGAPNSGGVPYRSMMVVAYLAPLPDSQDLTFLKTRVSDLVFDTLGVRGQVLEVVTSVPTVIDHVEHESLEKARQVTIAATETDYAKFLRVSRELQQAREHVKMLEQYIENNPAK